MGSAQVPQIGGTAKTGSSMAEEGDRPATPAVCSLARPWESRGTGNGSRVYREVPARSCEGLWVKPPRSTLLALAAKEAVVQVGEIPRDLRHPSAVGMGSSTRDLHGAVGDIDEDQNVVCHQSPDRAHL